MSSECQHIIYSDFCPTPRVASGYRRERWPAQVPEVPLGSEKNHFLLYSLSLLWTLKTSLGLHFLSLPFLAFEGLRLLLCIQCLQPHLFTPSLMTGPPSPQEAPWSVHGPLESGKGIETSNTLKWHHFGQKGFNVTYLEGRRTATSTAETNHPYCRGREEERM